MTASHGQFTIERIVKAPPARVYAAWSTKEGKEAWFAAPDKWTLLTREFDFREGGRERLAGKWASGMVTTFDALYRNIVPNERIVYVYDMWIDDKRISVSLATVQFEPHGAGTKLIVTEQGVFVDGYDDAGSRERGTGDLMDQLVRAVEGK
ncbi:MAG TPA: SRPBCC family protein [Rhizomicrobium sp.]